MRILEPTDLRVSNVSHLPVASTVTSHLRTPYTIIYSFSPLNLLKETERLVLKKNFMCQAITKLGSVHVYHQTIPGARSMSRAAHREARHRPAPSSHRRGIGGSRLGGLPQVTQLASTWVNSQAFNLQDCSPPPPLALRHRQKHSQPFVYAITPAQNGALLCVNKILTFTISFLFRISCH